DVDAEVAPREVLGVALRQHFELLAGRGDRAVAGRDAALEPAEHRVVLEQVRHRLRIAEIVDRDDVDVGPLLQLGAKEVPPNAPEPVDPDFDRHTPPELDVATSL